MRKKSAVILVNLGTPVAATPKAVGHFLKIFLSDPRVVEIPRLIWWFVLRFIVIPLRAKKVARAYRSIWLKEGSPLRVISHQQQLSLQEQLQQQQIDVEVFVGETYAEVSLSQQIQQLSNDGFDKFLVIPMYPQYSCSTTGAIYDQLAKLALQSRNVPDVRVVKSFHNHSQYIQALANSVTHFWSLQGRGDKLLMSFHGIPKDYVEKGDPYYQHCKETATLLARALQLNDDSWQLCFQSRFGPKKWLQPYTDETLLQLAKQPETKVDVISPAFVADCLETLEELNLENRELFLAAGGKGYSFIPCLNDDKSFIELLVMLVKQEFVDNK